MKFTKINIDTYEGWIPNKADLVIAEKDNIEEVLEKNEKSTLTEFFKLCAKDEFAATLLYY